MKVEATPADKLGEIMLAANAFRSHFAENSAKEWRTFYQAWTNDDARKARCALNWGRFDGAEDLRWILARVAEWRESGWPHELFGRAGDSSGAEAAARFAGEWQELLGARVVECFETGNGALLRKLADAAEGKINPVDFAPRSDWKHKLLEALLELIQASPGRLPTKKALRELVEAMHRRTGKASEVLDDRTYRNYIKELGLNGLPSAPGRRGKQQRPPVDRVCGKRQEKGG